MSIARGLGMWSPGLAAAASARVNALAEKAVRAGRLYNGCGTGAGSMSIRDQQRLYGRFTRALEAVSRAVPYDQWDGVQQQIVARIEALGPLTPQPGKDY